MTAQSPFTPWSPWCMICGRPIGEDEMTQAKSREVNGNSEGLPLHRDCSELRYVLQHNYLGGDDLPPDQVRQAWTDFREHSEAEDTCKSRPYRRASYLALNIGKHLVKNGPADRENPWLA